MKYEKFNLVDPETNAFLKYNLKGLTTKRDEAYWSTASGIDALLRTEPQLLRLKKVNVNDYVPAADASLVKHRARKAANQSVA